MLTLLCTAPSSSLRSPIEGTSPSTPPPPNSSGASFLTAGPTSGSSPVSNRKLSMRRPSIRKRIQSISRVSTATLSNAAGSSLSFFRHTSGSGSRSSSSTASSSSPTSNATASASGNAHTRGASTSSFASGWSSKSNKSTGSSSGHGGRLNVLNISAPSAFKHQFHLGPNTRTSDGAWDDDLPWCHVRPFDRDDIPVIDVVPPEASNAEQRSHSGPIASASSPNLPSISTSNPTASVSTPTPTSSTESPSSEPPAADKTKRQVKRASLVKRKPVPPLNPEDIEPVPSTPTPAQATYVLIPDLGPAKGRGQARADVGVPETAPAGKTSFEVSKEVAQKEALEKLERAAEPKASSSKEGAATTPVLGQTQASLIDAPEHIYILHPAPAPKPPPRRHTLAHMQARALGRGLSNVPPLRSGSGVSTNRDSSATSESQNRTLERKRSRARPVPFVAPSPSPEIVEDMTVERASGPGVLPGLTTMTEEDVKVVVVEKKPKEQEETKTHTHTTVPVLATVTGNSPRPSLSSLASSAESSETTRSTFTSSTFSGEPDSETEPRTPTDEKRVSAFSAFSISQRPKGPRNVRIVVPGESNPGADESDADEADGGDSGGGAETPKVLRCVSKRPNPPARRVEASEDSVYVTADEADDL